jgi:SWI/SNF-related matrix-associated actin-dependent regulator 1 of chromatin subfamily A
MELRPFQDEGAAFLAESRAGLLADEMGLGKTPQAVAAAARIGAGSVLVLSKAIARGNWRREWLQWCQDPDAWQVCLPSTKTEIPAEANLLIVNYDIVHHPNILSQLLQRRFDVLIADEMHVLKGASDYWSEDGKVPRRAQAVLDPTRGLWRCAGAVWGLSGTPAPNHAGELYGWLRTLHSRYVAPWPTYEDFLRCFTRGKPSPFGWRVFGNRNTDEMRGLLSNVMIRRRRADVLPELPGLQINDTLLSADNVPRSLQALEDHPEYAAVIDVLDSLEPDDNPEAALRVGAADMGTLRRLTGLAKVEAAAERIADELRDSTDKIVVMCWHRETIARLADLLDGFGVVTLHGGTTDTQKQKNVDAFQEGGTECRVLIGNIQTAGESITLTAAARMVILEPSFVPKDNEQAILRIMRYGQHRACSVDFLGLDGSLDATIMAVYARKARLLAEVLS